MVLLAVFSFTKAFWRHSLASNLLMMVLCLGLQDDYHSKFGFGKTFVVSAANSATWTGGGGGVGVGLGPVATDQTPGRAFAFKSSRHKFDDDDDDDDSGDPRSAGPIITRSAITQDNIMASSSSSSSSLSSPSSPSPLPSLSSSTNPLSSSSSSSPSSSSFSHIQPSIAATLKPRKYLTSSSSFSNSLSLSPSTSSATSVSLSRKRNALPKRRRTSTTPAPTRPSSGSINPADEGAGPRFDAMISETVMDATDPCYNFTIGNLKEKEFYSPRFGDFYPNDTECERVIKAPLGHQIVIEFRDQFHLEEATNCEYDYLEIRDGAYGYSTPLAKLCGPYFPRDITSNDRYLFLRFVSDDSIEYLGFKAVYKFVRMKNEKPEPPHDCRFSKTGVSGLISYNEISGNMTTYSVSQDVSIDCMWNITVAPGYKMYLNFKDYKLATPNNCESNYIDIYGEKLSDLGRKSRFCGTQAEPLRSDGNQMNIRFFSKPESLTGTVFEITFTAFREVTNKEKCYSDEFDCEDSTCIAASLRCDGVDNCKYRYDEDKQTTCAPSNQGVLNLNSQHMVVILIVFCALVFGMCASITISCWSKIEERRQRKREYKERRSREASMEVGLDRTMTITSLDRSTTGCVLEHPDQASSSSGSRCRKTIVTANAIRHKPPDMSAAIVDDDLIMMDGSGALAYYDSEENGCYVPDIEMHSPMHSHHPHQQHPHQSQQQPQQQSLHHHANLPSTSQYTVYPSSTERRSNKMSQSNGATLPHHHHLDSGDKYSPDTPTPPHQQMLIGSPNGPSGGGGAGGQSPLVTGGVDYYNPALHNTANQIERDSIRSGSECSIPPPPPPPALSHFRNRVQTQQQQPQFRTLPLDASKLSDPNLMAMSENHNQSTLPYRGQHNPAQLQQQQQQRNPLSLSQQQLSIAPLHHSVQHHPDCAQHKLQQQQQQQQQPIDSNYIGQGTLRRGYYTTNNRPGNTGTGGGDAGDLLNDDVDDGCIIDECDESGVGAPEHRSAAMELTDDVAILDDDVLTDTDLYPSNGRLPQQQQPHHYLLRDQSTLDDEDDSATAVPLTSSNTGYGSGGGGGGGGNSGPLTPPHLRQPYFRSEAVIEMGAAGGGDGARQGLAMMR